jgi:hypothetical protein
MKQFIKIINTVSVLLAGMMLSSVFITHSDNLNYYVVVLFVLITVRNFVKD